MPIPEEKSLGTFEKYLAGWVAACMAAGLVLSQTILGISTALNAWQIRGISVPIMLALVAIGKWLNKRGFWDK